jgi:hypothetical protein
MRKYIDILGLNKFTIDEALVNTYKLNTNSIIVRENMSTRLRICFIILKFKRKMRSIYTPKASDTSHQLYGYVGQRMNEQDRLI